MPVILDLGNTIIKFLSFITYSTIIIELIMDFVKIVIIIVGSTNIIISFDLLEQDFLQNHQH
jgi:hypothetical protein